MNGENPYQTPEASGVVNFEGDSEFEDLDDESLKKLYHRSCNVSCIAFLLVLAVFSMVDIVYSLPRIFDLKFEVVIGVGIGVILFFLITVVGLIMRTSWGRIMGIFVCILSLVSIPIGTLVGVAGLFAFFKAPNLFGENRVTHKALKAEFKIRKKRKKLAQ